MSETEPLAITAQAGPSLYHGTSVALSEAADRLGVSLSTVRRWLRAGELDGAHQQRTPNGLAWFVPVATIEQLKSAGRAHGTPPARQAAPSAGELDELRQRLHAQELELAALRALATERAQQIDELHSTMRTLAITAGSTTSTTATAEPRKRWWRKAAP